MVQPLNVGREPPGHKDEAYMRTALEEAARAGALGEVPVGALVVDCHGTVLARACNLRESIVDPTGHAEVLAIREAARVTGSWRLGNATLYVTKEPCPMCAGAIVNARIRRVVFGCLDEKGGAVLSLFRLLDDERLNHRVQVTSGVLAEEGRKLLQDFFRARRE